MWPEILAVMAGFALLVWGADRFVAGAAATARNLGVAPLIIGLTVVGFGTSAPEILVSAVAAWQGNPGLAIGNALGSNITNIGLVLGATAVVLPLRVHSITVKREMPLLLVVMLGGLLLMLDGELNRLDGVLLLAALAVLLTWIVHLAITGRTDPLGLEYAQEIRRDLSTAQALFWLAAGLVILLLSSQMLVWGATAIAVALGVSDLVIGLTIVALGTSLPELAASIMGALKGEHDIALGNVIGSNIFNLLAVMGMPGLIAPGPFEGALLTRDYPVMVGFTVALLGMAYGWRGPRVLNRLEGGLLLAAYAGYQGLIYFSVRGDIHLPTLQP